MYSIPVSSLKDLRGPAMIVAPGMFSSIIVHNLDFVGWTLVSGMTIWFQYLQLHSVTSTGSKTASLWIVLIYVCESEICVITCIGRRVPRTGYIRLCPMQGSKFPLNVQCHGLWSRDDSVVYVPSVTAAIIWLSLPVVEVAVLGRAVLGRFDVDALVDVAGLLEGYGALWVLASEGVLAVVPDVKNAFRAGMVMSLIQSDRRKLQILELSKFPRDLLMVLYFSIPGCNHSTKCQCDIMISYEQSKKLRLKTFPII